MQPAVPNIDTRQQPGLAAPRRGSEEATLGGMLLLLMTGDGREGARVEVGALPEVLERVADRYGGGHASSAAALRS